MSKAVVQPEVIINVDKAGTRKPVFADVLLADSDLKNRVVEIPFEKVLSVAEHILTKAVDRMIELEAKVKEDGLSQDDILGHCNKIVGGLATGLQPTESE